MGSGSQINGALKLIGRRNYCDECVMVRRRRRPEWIRVSTPQSRTQTAPCVLIYPEKPLQPLGLLLPDPPLLCPSPLARWRTVILQDLDGPRAQTLKWALACGGGRLRSWCLTEWWPLCWSFRYFWTNSSWSKIFIGFKSCWNQNGMLNAPKELS